MELQTLEDRRLKLCEKFAENCLKHEKSKDMFPLDTDRNDKMYKVKFTENSRLLNSAIPQMQRILNKNSKNTQ